MNWRAKKPVTAAGIVITAVILVASAVLVFVLLTGSRKPPVYTVNDTSLTVSAQFGTAVALSDITGVQLKDTMPDNLRRTSGAALGTILKGNFKSGDVSMKIYADTAVPPFIYIDTASGLVVIIGDQTADLTRALFRELQDAISKAS